MSKVQEKKSVLKAAIRSLGRYTDKQCEVFDALVDRAVGNVTHFSINNMSKITKVTRPTIYNTLKTFQKDGILSEEGNIGTYKLQDETLDIMISLHLKQEELNNSRKK